MEGEGERAAMKMLLMPNFHWVSIVCDWASSWQHRPQPRFQRKGNLLVFLFFSPTFSPHFKSPTRLHMIGHPARTCTCDPSATSLPPLPPILKSTVVTRLSDLFGLIPGSGRWRWRALLTAPHCAAKGVQLRGGPTAELFLPIRTLCTKALKQPPLWHDDNVQFHTASWRLTVYYVCKVFFNKSWYWILSLLCSFCRFEKNHQKSILL